MKNFFAKPEIKIEIYGDPSAKELLKTFSDLDYPTFVSPTIIKGKVTFIAPEGKTVNHKGLNIILFGDFRDNENHLIHRFFIRKQIISPEGKFSNNYESNFTFDSLNFPTATYYGSINAIFGIEANCIHTFSNTTEYSQFIILNFSPKLHPVPIHNEIGMKNVLHIEFIFPQSNYDCGDCVVGSAYFILVKLRIVQLFVEIFRFESFTSNLMNFEKKTLLKSYQFLDGVSVRGDHVPIRIFLRDADIWPYVPFPGSNLKVEHYLRTHIVDENGKSYYKRLKIKIDRVKQD